MFHFYPLLYTEGESSLFDNSFTLCLSALPVVLIAGFATATEELEYPVEYAHEAPNRQQPLRHVEENEGNRVSDVGSRDALD